MNEALFDNIINTAQDCVFWKDRDRRFVGVNQAFLDYYGFDSADVLIGKNDEEMGWHSDPEPFKQDELRVLEGHSTYKVQGKCVIRGEERDIVASKRPIYDGDEIIGLVGSFIDITDVLRKGAVTSGRQGVYTVDTLRTYPYFDRILNETPVGDILDPLTGVISRGFFLNFVKDLIRTGTPFSFCFVDLDNFKYINDTYGHGIGDVVLSSLAGKLASYIMKYGLVGRFGGDELMLINTRDITSGDMERFFDDAYNRDSVLRMNVETKDLDIYITATAGCASFPADTEDYDSLFEMVDKTLYCGKNKGRNCYTVYDKDEHEALDIKQLAKQGLFSNLNNLTTRLENADGFENRLTSVMSILQNGLGITEMYYVGKGARLHSPIDRSMSYDVADIGNLVEDELWAGRGIKEIKDKCPKLYEALEKLKVGSAIIAKIGLNSQTDGYLILAGGREDRIWQEDECGMVYFIAKSLAAYLRLGDERIPD